MSDRLSTIAHFQSFIEARMARLSLADRSIESVVVGDNALILFPSPAIETSQLQVFEGRSLPAKEIVESLNRLED